MLIGVVRGCVGNESRTCKGAVYVMQEALGSREAVEDWRAVADFHMLALSAIGRDLVRSMMNMSDICHGA